MVDGIERTMEGKMDVVHLDVATDDGASMLDTYDVHTIPAFIVLDAKGKVLYRQIGGRPNGDAIAAKVGGH